jgi:PAS domain S-box-containing protein
LFARVSPTAEIVLGFPMGGEIYFLMKDDLKTKKELIHELARLKRRITRLEKSAAETDKRISVNELDDKSRHIFENVNDPMIYLDKIGIIVEVNKEAVKIFGGLKEELVGRHFTKIGIFYPEDIPELLSSFKSVLGGKHASMNLQIKNKKRETFFIDCSASPMKTGGKISGMVAIMRDITERRRAVEALRESERFLQNIFGAIQDGISVLDADLNVIRTNYWMEKMYADQLPLKGRKCYRVYQRRESPCPWCPSLRTIETGETNTEIVPYPSKEDPKGWIELTAFPVRDEQGHIKNVIEYVKDITARKLAEDAMRNSEERFRSLAEMLPEAVFETDQDLHLTFANRRAFKLFGYSDEDLMRGLNGLDMIAPEDRERAKENLARRAKGENPGTIEYRALRKDGSTFPVLFHANAIIKEGKVIGLRGVVVNITDRKQSEEALRSSEERYRKLVENATEGIVVVQDRFVKFANPRIEEISSYSREELLSKPFLDFIHPDDREFVIDNQIKRLKGESIPETYEIRMINKYGETRWLKIGGVIISWEGKPASLNFIVDITETKRLRELESRAQRLETAGQIAGQVAHDFNNLLAPLITYPEFIRRDLTKNHPALPYLKDIEKAAHKIADINQQLLTLGRRGHYNLVPLNLNDVINEILNELVSLPETLVIETELASDLLNIKAGRAQINRMISNIINNSRDAAQDIGRIVIKTENFYADNIVAIYGRVPRGEYVKLTISDTGHGISKDIIQNIFDPFFTTKTADKRRGSGLGLSVVDSVIKDHDGFLDLRSKVGDGTSFFLYFPITRENIDDRVSGQIIGGNESVLVVDDDDVQSKVSSKILTSLGYRVTTIESGEKAVELLRQQPHDLLILDMIMTPGIDGTETLRQVLEINPGQKTIIISGFAETERVKEALELGAGAFIRKPITIKKMADAVRKELDKKEEVFAF